MFFGVEAWKGRGGNKFFGSRLCMTIRITCGGCMLLRALGDVVITWVEKLVNPLTLLLYGNRIGGFKRSF